MREIIELPDRRHFTQGSIFDGIQISDDISGYGIIITARCDIANSKARNILFLPIYSMRDWLSQFGEDIILRRSKKSLKQNIIKHFNKMGIAEEVIDIYPTDSLTPQITDKKIKKELSILIEAYKNNRFSTEIPSLKKEREQLISSIMNNTENSIYFIEQVHTDKIFDAYIIDLTNPISIPFHMADGIRKGLTKELVNNSNIFKKWDQEFLYSYISVLKSPYIEHLLQKFSLYYSRIGTDDVDSEYKRIIQEQFANA